MVSTNRIDDGTMLQDCGGLDDESLEDRIGI
jgi:hypothetical protein